jgi:hypothetical protein
MSRMTYDQRTDYSRPAREPDMRTAMVGRTHRGGGVSGWLLAGLALAGLGAAAWYYLGPDLKRYMKIRNM